jgi:hypothetical protein
MFIILIDRAFCENCYGDLQKKWRKLIDEHPKKAAEPMKPKGASR